MMRFYRSYTTAHRMVQQRVQGKVAITSTQTVNTRIVFVTKEKCNESELVDAVNFPISVHALTDFKAKPQELQYLYPISNEHADQRALLVGLGEEAKVTENGLREATHTALHAIRRKHAKNVVLDIPNISLKTERMIEVITQASMLSNYQFDKYLSETNQQGEPKLCLPLEQILLKTSTEFQEQVEEQVTIAEETIFARNLGNERSDIVNPAFMEEVAKASLELPNMSMRVLQMKDLLSEGLNMFVSVGQAATCPPRLVLLEYKGNPDAPEDCVALVGKGITFDTGGLNLKPTGSIEDMHTDMCGSAAVLGAVRAVARRGLKINLVCALALAENAIGSRSTKPHTILKSHNGMTVENNNTDAEGRLVLADTLSYVQQQYKPKTVIDVATLTGACMVALGEHCAGLFSNSDGLANQLLASGTSTHERCWRLPILPEHTAALKGTQTDSRSCGKGRYGGASTAAAFLQQFIHKDVEWAHVDIAGPSNYSSAKSYFPQGATGFGVQLLYNYLKTHQHKP